MNGAALPSRLGRLVICGLLPDGIRWRVDVSDRHVVYGVGVKAAARALALRNLRVASAPAVAS